MRRFVFHERYSGCAVWVVLEALHDPSGSVFWVGVAVKVDDSIAPSMAAASVPACDAAGVVAPPRFFKCYGEVLHGLATPQFVPPSDQAVSKTRGGRLVLFESGIDGTVGCPSDKGQQRSGSCSIWGLRCVFECVLCWF